MKKWFSFLICFQLFALNLAFAQEQDDVIKNTQDDILLVAAAGAGGAVLGLSTLSFYDTPSQHISNLWTGAAIGIIAGVIFVAYNSAQKGSEDLVSKHSSQEFSTSERVGWHVKSSQLVSQQTLHFSTDFLNYSF
jgi:hypothetical protein